MTASEKKKKAALVAVAYYLEQEAAKNNEGKTKNSWLATGKEIAMGNRVMVQRHGRAIRSRG